MDIEYDMKVYQEKWLKELYNGQVISVCADILRDDTGGTDELTMKLAEIVLNLTERLIKND